MPRRLRNLQPDSIVHCVNRGNDKRALFTTTREYEDFLRMAVWAKGQCAVRILAYCLMVNHWHFVFWARSTSDVSRFLHRLTTTHATSWRKRTDTVGAGHVYQGRFHDSKIFSERYYFNVLRYVEQNPLRAGIVKASLDWRWSSLHERLRDDRGIIEEGPLPLPTGWPSLVDEHLDSESIQEIRNDLQRH
jgi:putative transposase